MRSCLPYERSARTSRLLAPTVGGTAFALGALLLFPTPPASAEDFALHLEPAAALWLVEPHSDRFSPGGYGAIRPSIRLGQIVSLQLSYAFLMAGASSEADRSGTAHIASAGVRFRPLATLRPETEQLGGLWVDLNGGYGRTGSLDRFVVDAGLGYGFQVTRIFAFGPAVRYLQIVQPNDRDGFDGRDAQALLVGLNFTLGPAPSVPAAAPPIAEPAPPIVVVQECLEPVCPQLARNHCIDFDGDGICDDHDRCPTQRGPLRTQGCPVNPCDGEPLQMIVQFEFDSAGMPVALAGDEQTMDPVLDAVAAAIALDSTCRVGILGHASEEGDTDHNQRLSEARASAVQRYLVARGVERERIPFAGMGDRCQLVPERSRVHNRRVEFFRLDVDASMPEVCLP